MLTLLALFLLGAPNAVPQQAAQKQPPPAASAYSQGEDYLNKRDYAKALAAYNRAIQLDPKQPEFYMEKCRALAGLQRQAEAVSACSEAIKLRPEYALALRDRGHLEINLGKYPEALADLKKAESLDKTDRGIYYHLGLAYYLTGDFKDAASSFQGCLRDSHQPSELIECAAWLYPSLRRSGQDAMAQQLLDKVQPNWQITGNTVYYFDRLLLFKGAKNESQVAATMKNDGALSQATVGYGLGLWELLGGNQAKAKEYFDKAIASGAKASFGYRASEVELKRMKG
ncbi:MAG TPA: tetratricopeptide repeat protein [Terriglobales bacterium]|nr:tetratricopeptide repeat protein [Terriglobales bacterium]